MISTDAKFTLMPRKCSTWDNSVFFHRPGTCKGQKQCRNL